MRLTIAALLFATLAAGCTGRDVRGPFRNQYIDAETGKPIEGVVFLAVWYSTNLNFVDGGGESFYDAREVVSGPDGRVEIPALVGPILRFPLNVRFHEFSSDGYEGARVQVTPSGTKAYVNPTITAMRRATVQQRCGRLPFASAMVSAGAAGKSPLYTEAIRRERAILNCGK